MTVCMMTKRNRVDLSSNMITVVENELSEEVVILKKVLVIFLITIVSLTCSVCIAEETPAVPINRLEEHSYDTVTPERLMAEHSEVLEAAARMLLDREDLFDEVYKRTEDHCRCIALVSTSSSLPYSDLLHDAQYGQEFVKYLSNEEKSIFQTLLDTCPPYEIEQLSGNRDTCTALIFRFSSFNEEAEQKKDQILICLTNDAGTVEYEKTIAQLSEQYGLSSQCSLLGWLIIYPEKP